MTDRLARAFLADDDVDAVDITAGDVEGVREDLLEDARLEEATDEYSAGWIDALIAMDMALTDPDGWRDDVDDPIALEETDATEADMDYGITD